nr:MAG TPA: hypothetical protein [Caudoviricetes sp.]
MISPRMLLKRATFIRQLLNEIKRILDCRPHVKHLVMI